MSTYDIEFADSLGKYSDERLDHITKASPIFLDRRWLRMLDSLDLEPLVGGACRLRYAVLRKDDEPVAVCPLLFTRTASIRIAYSFRKTFFTAWQEDLLRINPTMEKSIGWLGSLALAYNKFTRRIGALPNTFILAVSPLSYRSGIAIAPLPMEEQQKVRSVLLDALKELATEERAALWFVRVPDEDTPLRSTLTNAGFHEVFILHDNLLENADVGIPSYLERFRARRRYKLKQDMSRAKSAGLRFELNSRLGELGHELSRHYSATYTKYGEHFAHPPAFWAAVERNLGDAAQAMLCYQGSKLLRFSVLLHKGDLWAYRGGGAEQDPSRVAYFNTLFYEPLRRAAALGCRRFWLGPGNWATKHQRGAVGHPLYSYFWFPTRGAGALLIPYIKLFGEISRRQLAFAATPSEGIKIEKESADD